MSHEKHRIDDVDGKSITYCTISSLRPGVHGVWRVHDGREHYLPSFTSGCDLWPGNNLFIPLKVHEKKFTWRSLGCQKMVGIGCRKFSPSHSTRPEVKRSPKMKTLTNFHASKNDSDQVPDTWWWLIALQDMQVCLQTGILLKMRPTQEKVKNHIFCDTFGHYSQSSVTRNETTISRSSEPLVTCDWTPGRNGTVVNTTEHK